MGKLYNVDIVNNKSTNGRGGGIGMSNSDIRLNQVNVLDMQQLKLSLIKEIENKIRFFSLSLFLSFYKLSQRL